MGFEKGPTVRLATITTRISAAMTAISRVSSARRQSGCA